MKVGDIEAEAANVAEVERLIDKAKAIEEGRSRKEGMTQQPPRRPIEETHPHLAEFASFLPKLNEESDRGMVLIATSFIDELLRRTLLAFMIEGKTGVSLVEGDRAPLGTFATRSAAAFALGLINAREKQEADRLRQVRNRFAHQVHVSFDDEKIATLCAQLDMAAKDYGDVTVGARGQFSSAALSLILNLTNRPHYVAQQRRGPANWRT